MKQDLAHVQPRVRRAHSLLTDTRGAGLVEYIVLVGLIALAAIMGFRTLGQNINDKATTLGTQVTGIQ